MNANTETWSWERTNTQQKEQLEYIQGQINEIKNLVEDRQSQIAWQTVNEVNRRKSMLREKKWMLPAKKNLYRREKKFQEFDWKIS